MCNTVIANRYVPTYNSYNSSADIRFYRVMSPKEYNRITIAILFFDDFTEQLQAGFDNHNKKISSLRKLLVLPKICNKFEILTNDFEMYSKFLDFLVGTATTANGNSTVENKINKPKKDRPNSAIEAYIINDVLIIFQIYLYF